MPIIILMLSLLGGALWFWVRNNPRDAIYAVQDAATVIKNAPRKLAFRKQTNAHPVEGIDDPRIAMCAIGQSFIELDNLPTIEQRNRLYVRLRTVLRCSESEAEEMEVLGRWLMGQCQGPENAIARLSRRLFKLDGGASWDVLQDFLGGIVEGELSVSQMDAITDIKRAFRR
jgi:hypothetical protein